MVAVAVATVAVSAALVVLTRPGDSASAADDPAPITTETPTAASDPPPPDARWTVDATAALGRNFAQFRSPTAGLDYDSDLYGIIDAGSTLVTAVGLPNPRGYTFDEAHLIGIDARDGHVAWMSPTGSFSDCATRPIGGEVVCFDQYSDAPALALVSIADGSIRQIPLPSTWFPYAIESDGQSVFVLEGSPEDSESFVHGGDPNALERGWSLPINGFGLWEDMAPEVLHVADGVGVVTLGSDAEFFDPRTGNSISDYSVGGTSVVDATGREVLTLPDPYASTTARGSTVQIADDVFLVGPESISLLE